MPRFVQRSLPTVDAAPAPPPGRLATQQSLNSAIWSICNILRRSNCAGALQYVPELTWILFLRILDVREEVEAEEAEAVGQPYTAFASLLGMLVALALVPWLTVARLVRAQVLSLKEREFVDAARALGASRRRILLRHLLPNTLAIIVVTATFGIPRAIVVEAALSFVGLGVQPPLTSWGAMILTGANAARAGLLHLILAPAAALSLTVLAYNFLGDGLRDALDPHLGGQAARTVRP